MQTRREILDELLDFVGDTDDSGARDTAELILNRVLSKIAGRRAWRQLLSPTPYELTTVANTRAYALPSHFDHVSGADGKIRNLTLGTEIFPIEREELEAMEPEAGTSLETAQPPQRYTLAGSQPVHTQPATTGDALEVLSSSVLDVAVRVEVVGINSLGQRTSTQVTLTGVAAVALGTWKEIHEFGKAYPDGTDPTTEGTSSAGTVTLRKVVGATELQVLMPEESAQERQAIVFWPMPDLAYSIAIPFIRNISRRFRDADSIPNGWEMAVMEEMKIEWAVQAGELSLAAAAQIPRPDYLDLVCKENAAAAQAQRTRRPYSD